jgi:hypothetical protein
MIGSETILLIAWAVERAIKYFIIYIKDRAKED